MLRPGVQRLVDEATALEQQGSLAKAAARLAQVRVLAPRELVGWHQSGMLALRLGQTADAVKCLTRALQLQPDSLPTTYGLCVALVAAGEHAKAETLLRQVVAAKPDEAEAWHYLALVLKSTGRFAESLSAQRRAVALKPELAMAWAALGLSLTTHGTLTEALACYDRALQLAPGDLRSRVGRAQVLFKSFQLAAAVEEIDRVRAQRPRELEAQSCRLFALNSLDGWSASALAAEHRAFGALFADPGPGRWTQSPESDRRLKVALLSPDLRDHSCAYFLEPLLRELDREAFEIVLYHDHEVVDDVSQRLRALADQWRHFNGCTADVVEQAIRADAPDILMDLAGHTGGNRMELFARRLAPVQITYLGYPNTTGLREMDYRLVDEVTDPTPTADAWHTEKLIRFAPTAWTYAPLADSPEPSMPPCLSGGSVTFGSFNNLTKMADGMLRLWAQLLVAVPGSRLLLKAGCLDEALVREPVLQRLAAAGLPLDRVELLKHTPGVAAHLSLYGRVDVALDTSPYAGTTTTCEALWMGVPVVTLAGERHASRVGASLLTAIGHPEWIAATPADYVRIAASLAQDPTRLANVRRGLRGELQASPLMAHAAQAERFGRALRDCWRRWCAQIAPTPELETTLSH